MSNNNLRPKKSTTSQLQRPAITLLTATSCDKEKTASQAVERAGVEGSHDLGHIMLLFRQLRDGLVGGGSSLFPCAKFWKPKRNAKTTAQQQQRSDNCKSQNKSHKHNDSDEEFSSTNTEEDLKRLEGSISRLLERLNDYPDETPSCPDDECVICVTGRASMQTYPCGHKVLCRKCFVKTIQVALSDRQLPLHCVVCRRSIVRLKQQTTRCPILVTRQRHPPGSYPVPVPSPLPSSSIKRPGYC